MDLLAGQVFMHEVPIIHIHTHKPSQLSVSIDSLNTLCVMRSVAHEYSVDNTKPGVLISA